MLRVKVTSLENGASGRWLLEAMLFSMHLPLGPGEAAALLIQLHPASLELQDRGLQKPVRQKDSHRTGEASQLHRWGQCRRRYLAGHVGNLDHVLVVLLGPSFPVLLAWQQSSNRPFFHGQQQLGQPDPVTFG